MLRRIQNRKQKKRKLMMAWITIFLMVFGVMGIFIGGSHSGSSDFEYNDYKFARNAQGTFITEIGDELYGFNFLPQTVDQIAKPQGLNAKLNSPMIYLTFDPDSEVQDLLYIDTVRNDLQTTLNTIVVNTISQESDVYLLPQITCANSTPFVPVFYFNVSNETSILERDSCIVLNGQATEFLKLRDLLVYLKYGVINEE